MPKVKPITPYMVAKYVANAPEIRAFEIASRQFFAFFFSQTASYLYLCRKNTVKSLWLLSHVCCLLGFLLYLVLRMQMFYRLSALGAASTFGLALFRHFRILVQSHPRVPFAVLLNSENATLLTTALLHLSSTGSIFKLASFAIFAVINLATYVVEDLVVEPKLAALDFMGTRLERALLASACYADYVAYVIYFVEWMCGGTPFIHWVLFTYLGAKRLEHSQLARQTLHNFIGIVVSVLRVVRLPLPSTGLDLDFPAHILDLKVSGPNLAADAVSLDFNHIEIINDI